MGDGTLKEYDLKEEKPTATELFKFPMGGDGLAIDSENNFYAALGDNTVRIMDKEGIEKQILYFDERPTSITFGGEDMKTVLITTEDKVYTIPANVQGLEMDEVVPQKKRDAIEEEEELEEEDGGLLVEEEEVELEDGDLLEEEELEERDIIGEGDLLEEEEEVELEDGDLLEEEEELEERDIIGEDEVISGSTKDEDLVRPTEKTQKKQALTNEDVEEELPLEEDAEDIKVLPVVEEEEEEELEDRDILEEKEEEEDLEVPLEKEELKVKEKGAPNKKAVPTKNTSTVKKTTNRTNNAAFFTSVSESEHEVTMMAGAGRGHKGKGNLRGEIEKEEKEIEKNVEDHH